MYPDLYGENTVIEDISELYTKNRAPFGFSVDVNPNSIDMLFRANSEKNCKNIKLILEYIEQEPTY